MKLIRLFTFCALANVVIISMLDKAYSVSASSEPQDSLACASLSNEIIIPADGSWV
jgi:hypothetical protein